MFLYRFSNYINLNENISWDNVFNYNLVIDEPNFEMPVKVNLFSLSENDKKNGNFLSFFFADGEHSYERIRKCFSSLKIIRRDSFPAFFGFCEINKELAEEHINDENEIISFSQEGKPTEEETIHYGMRYLTNNELDILEAKNSLVSLSNFFPCKNKCSPREIGFFSNDQRIDYTKNLD